jgi:hypothetical protein
MLQPESTKELLLSFLALLPSVLDKDFKGELRLSCHCEERSPRRGNPLFKEIASLSLAMTCWRRSTRCLPGALRALAPAGI